MMAVQLDGETEIAVHGEVQYLEKDGMGCLV